MSATRSTSRGSVELTSMSPISEDSTQTATEVAVAPTPAPTVKSPLSKEEREAKERRIAKAEKIERAYLAKLRGPLIKARLNLPEEEYDIVYLCSLSEDDLDEKQRQIDRITRNITGCEIFSTGVPVMAPAIEKVLVWFPWLKEQGWDFHGFAQELNKDPKIPLILEVADDELNDAIGVNPLITAAVSMVTAAKNANSRNIKRNEALRMYGLSIQQAQKAGRPLPPGTGYFNPGPWKAEMERDGLTAVDMLNRLMMEHSQYQMADKMHEAQARALAGDVSHMPGARNAPNITAPAPTKPPAVMANGRPLHQVNNHHIEEEHKSADSDDSDDDD